MKRPATQAARLPSQARLAEEAMRAAAVMLGELQVLERRMDFEAIARAARLILAAERKGGRVHLLGVGKPLAVAKYLAGSLSSTGTPAYAIAAAEAAHGGAGQILRGDVVIAISNSGETAETRNATALARSLGARVIGVAGKRGSWLARNCDVFLEVGVAREGDRLNLAPRASVLAEILVLNALSVALQDSKRLTPARFRTWHPGGALGKKGR